MKTWIENLKEKTQNFEFATESLILSELPSVLIEDWENFMRGKTCPVLDNGDRGVYSWDVKQFIGRYM